MEPTWGFLCYSGHSAKSDILPSTNSVTVIQRRDGDFFYRVSDKIYSVKKNLLIYSSSNFLCRVLHSVNPSPSDLFPVVTTRHAANLSTGTTALGIGWLRAAEAELGEDEKVPRQGYGAEGRRVTERGTSATLATCWRVGA